ncbi:hypothetical protein Lepto7375DRAFT_4640 [Leptolyngbya sp. PCC 7375]|nr:hypothetical protein Lepto7375DRAFT_4640 [Leptolyngbya sp. PCC 7375]
MMASELEREAQQAITLLKSFSLELAQYSPESQVLYWLSHYRANWIRDAIIEAVYQGRYKVISVQHILSLWQRRGQPIRHFTSGFEQVIADHLGTPLHLTTAPQPAIAYPSHTMNELGQRNTMSSSGFTETVSTAKGIHSRSSAVDYGHYPGLSIEAFPVKPEDTLVEVYQADPSHQPHQTMASKAEARPKASPHKTEATYSDYIPMVRSAPIQPFRPTLQLQRISRV